MWHLLITLIEIGGGIILGILMGVCSALLMSAFKPVKHWLLPVLVISQAIPVFALAPILILWLGYGMGSKIAMAVLIIFFPVTAAFYDGLRRTHPQWLELARIMGADTWTIIRQIRVPSAMPALASGIRIAATVAPIGAVVGEWISASQGLGYYMLHANARMQIDNMFAALTVLAMVSLTLYFTIDAAINRLIFWETPKDLIHEKTH
jgi:putative hydroxymethylpyrimidine transport system permease protein